MKRLVFVFLFVALMLGCATSPPHTANDVSRRYSASLVTVFEACKMAIQDIGADHLEPTFELKDGSAAITAATRTRLYGVLLFGYDDHTDVMLFLEDKSTQDVIRKSVFDEFWAAVEAHL